MHSPAAGQVQPHQTAARGLKKPDVKPDRLIAAIQIETAGACTRRRGPVKAACCAGLGKHLFIDVASRLWL